MTKPSIAAVVLVLCAICLFAFFMIRPTCAADSAADERRALPSKLRDVQRGAQAYCARMAPELDAAVAQLKAKKPAAAHPLLWRIFSPARQEFCRTVWPDDPVRDEALAGLGQRVAGELEQPHGGNSPTAFKHLQRFKTLVTQASQSFPPSVLE